MKQLYLFFFSTLTLLQTTGAQSSFGLKAGVNYSEYKKEFRVATSEPYRQVSTKSLIGYQFGFFYKRKFSTNISVATEANLSIIGAKTYFSNISNTGQIRGGYFKDKVGYIDLPILFNYHIGKLYVGFGPSIAYKVFSNVVNYPEDWPSERKTLYKPMDLSANTALGFSIMKQIDVVVRYTYGLTNVAEYDVMNIKNRYLNASILYSLK